MTGEVRRYENICDENDIAISNALWSAVIDLSLEERRLLLVALSRIRQDMQIEPNQPFYIYKDDFVRFGYDPANAVRDIRNACKTLQRSIVTIPTLLGELDVPWLHSVLYFKTEVFDRLKAEYPNSKYDEEFLNRLRLQNLLDSLEFISKSPRNVMARIVFHENMLPFISELKGNFTRMRYDQAFRLSGRHSFRIFMYMMRFQDTGSIYNQPIDQFRKIIVGEDKYANFKDFKKRVLDPAMTEIEEKTDFQFLRHGEKNEIFHFKTSGRKYTHIGFNFRQKAKALPPSRDVWLNFKMTDAQLGMFGDKLARLTGESVEQIMLELSDVYKQGKWVEKLKELDFKPSHHYRADELDAMQAEKERKHADKLAKAKEQAQELELALDVYNDLLKADDETVEWFVTANQRFFGSFGAEKHHFDRGEYHLCLQAMKFRFENLSMFRQFDLSML